MPRFVILQHDHPFLHWDLMLESDGFLRTWRLLAEPSIETAIESERLSNHRLAYLDYEGPVSGNRGTVVRWDAGDFVVASETAEEIVLWFSGNRLSGSARLDRIADDSWQFRLGEA